MKVEFILVLSDFKSYLLGDPVQLNIFYNWFVVEVPWNKGFSLII